MPNTNNPHLSHILAQAAAIKEWEVAIKAWEAQMNRESQTRSTIKKNRILATRAKSREDSATLKILLLRLIFQILADTSKTRSII